ncbi:MAG TPA: bifunctional oligoribonuclease/PAP phosphatase NrnA [Prolixibacteraceae bacterium]|nr:bifunctional oligoribonuclease/PAP phosphatase NrnA [Prolixibacteraceae bacterium]
MENTGNEIINGIRLLLDGLNGPVVVVPHSNPDGDAIGAAFGLARVLKNAGFAVSIVSPNDYPTFLSWLEGDIEIVNFLKSRSVAESRLRASKLMFCVDFNEIDRVDEMKDALAAYSGKKVLIDHHPFPKDFCDWMVSESTYSSTAELVYDVVDALGLGQFWDKQAAEAIYTGIMTDTGSFSHNTSRPNLYRVLTGLMTFGIDTEAVHERVYHNFSAHRLQLLGYCLAEKLVVLPEFRTAYISITRDELKKYNFVPGDTEGFVNYPLSINNIVFSALFIEKDGWVKASFRSKGSFPANAFSEAHFGGGGHLNAAGGEAKLTLMETLEKFTQLLPDYLHQLESAN